MREVHEIIDKIKEDATTATELLQYLDSKLLLVRANTILAIVRLNKHDKKVIEKLVTVAQGIDADSPVIGNITNSKLAVAALKRLNTR